MTEQPIFPAEEGIGGNLGPGLLTTKGFQQHIALGKRLAVIYKDFLASHLKSQGDLYVRSTNYQRTVLSVGGMQIGRAHV